MLGLIGDRAKVRHTGRYDNISFNIKTTYTYIIIYMYVYIYISRIRRNLSIHIARFSASESPRAYINTPKNPHFSLVAGTSLVAMRRGSDSACVSIPHAYSFFARIRDMLCSF